MHFIASLFIFLILEADASNEKVWNCTCSVKFLLVVPLQIDHIPNCGNQVPGSLDIA